MAKIQWDQVGDRFYNDGVDQVVLFTDQQDDGSYATAEGWNGVASIAENPTGGEATSVYANNAKYMDAMSAENFGATIEAYMSPETFDECDGMKDWIPGVKLAQQTRKRFGLAYRNFVGNDTEGNDHGYEIHLVWNAMATPSSKTHSTKNESADIGTLSWDVTTTPVSLGKIDGVPLKPVAHIIFKSWKLSTEALKYIEDTIYGTDEAEPSLPALGDLLETLKTMNA